jgi:sialidase-1
MPLTWTCLTLLAAPPPPTFVDVFRDGADGFPSVRIPCLVVTPAGTLLAIAEGRQRHADQAANQLVLKRSTDGGATWSAAAVIAADGDNSLNNPCAVVDHRNGRVLLMYQRIPAHLTETSAAIAVGYEGPEVYRNLLLTSDDDGRTWSGPRDVTRGTKRPDGATTVASGPGLGLQLTRGLHAGRLLMPFNQGPFWHWQNYAAYSDDDGETWRCGDDAPGAMVPDAKHGQRSQINEVQFVELADGAVRLNSRPFAGARVRKTAVSRDGGQTWSPITDVPELRDPSCMASILRVGEELVFSGPCGEHRAHGTIWLSPDDGATWPVHRELLAGSFGYSVLGQLPDGTVLCLFETDEARRICLALFSLEWVRGGAAGQRLR